MAAIVDDGNDTVELLRRIGRPYGASIQHCEMLAKLREPQPQDFDALLSEIMGPVELFPSFSEWDWNWTDQQPYTL